MSVWDSFMLEEKHKNTSSKLCKTYGFIIMAHVKYYVTHLSCFLINFKAYIKLFQKGLLVLVLDTTERKKNI